MERAARRTDTIIEACSVESFTDYEYVIVPNDKTRHNVVVIKPMTLGPCSYALVMGDKHLLKSFNFQTENLPRYPRDLTSSKRIYQSNHWPINLCANNDH